jgi:hypothetical protein
MLHSGPGDVAAVPATDLHRDDDQRLSYSSGDRELLRRYGRDDLARLSFAALPRTPFEALQRYFEDPIDAAELDEERVRALGFFRVPSPRELAAAERAFAAEGDPAARASRALEIAALHASCLALDDALRWIGTALAADPTTGKPEQVAVVQRVVRGQAVVYPDRIRAWLDALTAATRSSPLVAAMRQELRIQAERESARRERYLLP